MHCADLGVPLSRSHLYEATETFIETLPGRDKLPFKDGRPGSRWARDFYRRHQDRLKEAIPYWQEQKRHAATNAETYTFHLAHLHALFEEYQFDATRIWNLDETGVCPGKDKTGKENVPYGTRKDGNYRLRTVNDAR